MKQAIEQRAQFDFIRYANVWEDAEVLCKAIQPTAQKKILSIASGGDNALALIAHGAEVVAVDLSYPQLACTELKAKSIQYLEYQSLLKFFGIKPSTDREKYYQRLIPYLSVKTRQYWDANQKAIQQGFIHEGKFEHYFKTFRQHILPLIHRRQIVLLLLQKKSLEERVDFYNKIWNNWRWRLLFKIFFSRFMMGRLGRDPEFFRYVEGNVASNILARTKHALTQLKTHNNPYLDYILTGNYSQTLPYYLHEKNYQTIKKNLSKLHLYHGSIGEVLLKEDHFDGFNLSDIFEYLNPDICTTIYENILKNANPGARLVYWNMLVPRSCPEKYQDKVRFLATEAEDLFFQDKAFFYSRLIIEEKRV